MTSVGRTGTGAKTRGALDIGRFGGGKGDVDDFCNTGMGDEDIFLLNRQAALLYYLYHTFEQLKSTIVSIS